MAGGASVALCRCACVCDCSCCMSHTSRYSTPARAHWKRTAEHRARIFVDRGRGAETQSIVCADTGHQLNLPPLTQKCTMDTHSPIATPTTTRTGAAIMATDVQRVRVRVRVIEIGCRSRTGGVSVVCPVMFSIHEHGVFSALRFGFFVVARANSLPFVCLAPPGPPQKSCTVTSLFKG